MTIIKSSMASITLPKTVITSIKKGITLAKASITHLVASIIFFEPVKSCDMFNWIRFQGSEYSTIYLESIV